MQKYFWQIVTALFIAAAIGIWRYNESRYVQITVIGSNQKRIDANQQKITMDVVDTKILIKGMQQDISHIKEDVKDIKEKLDSR